MILRTWSDRPDEPVSHNPLVRKRVWIRNGEVDGLTQVSRASLPPGEICKAHSHNDMWEMFLVEKGDGQMFVNGRRYAITAGDCVVIAPGEIHELANTSAFDLIVVTTGWTVMRSHA